MILVEVAHLSVYGKHLKDSDIDAFLTKYWDSMKLNYFDGSGKLLSGVPTSVAISSSFLSKWYIDGYGVIPRWSPWSKKLDQKREELLEKKEERRRAPLSEL